MMFAFDARQADEGRSFLSKKGGGNRLGEKLFDERVSIHADPADLDVPVLPWDGEGLPREKIAYRRQGQGGQPAVLALLGQAEQSKARPPCPAT